jgi:mRNA interferase RelE/StbE
VSRAAWRLELTSVAQRDLRRLDPQIRTRVERALRALADDPQRAGALRKLTGAPEWRIRIGDWRALVLMDAQARTVHVTRVLPRGRAYRD